MWGTRQINRPPQQYLLLILFLLVIFIHDSVTTKSTKTSKYLGHLRFCCPSSFVLYFVYVVMSTHYVYYLLISKFFAVFYTILYLHIFTMLVRACRHLQCPRRINVFFPGYYIRAIKLFSKDIQKWYRSGWKRNAASLILNDNY